MSVKTWDELEKIEETIDGIKVTMAELQAIIVTAWEGGSTHWIKLAMVNHPSLPTKPRGMATSEWAFDALLNGGTIDFTPNADVGIRSSNLFTLTMGEFKKGLTEFFAIDRGRMYPAVADTSLDASHIDANDADSIVQLSIFKGVIFS